MKKYFLCLSILLSVFTAFSQDNFTVKVKLENFNDGTPFLSYMKKGDYVIETSYTTDNGQMVFKGTVDGPVVASFGVRNDVDLSKANASRTTPRTPLSFVLTNELINIDGDVDKLNKAIVKGGRYNKAFIIEKANLEKLVQAEKAKAKERAAKGDSVAGNGIEISSATVFMNQPLQKLYVAAYPESLLSMLYLYTLSSTMSLEDLKIAYSKMGAVHKTGLYGSIISDKIAALDATSAGKTAVAIDKVDLNGNAVNLESLKGKYVLLDFWGSWCGPCRASHPHLKSLYSKYKSAGFEIVGIAQEQKSTLEESKIAWKKAITEDQINWIQVLNNEGIEKSDAVKAYGVSVFPTKLLLDKEGKVMDRYIGDTEEINAALNKVFGF